MSRTLDRLLLVAAMAAAAMLAQPRTAAAQVAPPPADTADGLAPGEVEVDVPPELLTPAQLPRLARQHYPEVLRRTGTEGSVVLEFTVAADGHVQRGTVHVVSVSHQEFLEPAMRVVHRLRFRPATFQGKAIAAPITLPIVFALHDA
ncbi:MAG TPA: energy transducer TonB [Longimicrobium sp.]